MWLWGLGGFITRGASVCHPPTPLIPSFRARCLQGFPLPTLSPATCPSPQAPSLAWSCFLNQNMSQRTRLPPLTSRPFPLRELLTSNWTCSCHCRICLCFHCPPLKMGQLEFRKQSFGTLEEVVDYHGGDGAFLDLLPVNHQIKTTTNTNTWQKPPSHSCIHQQELCKLCFMKKNGKCILSIQQNDWLSCCCLPSGKIQWKSKDHLSLTSSHKVQFMGSSRLQVIKFL